MVCGASETSTYLNHAMVAVHKHIGDRTRLYKYSEKALGRLWKARRFLHTFPESLV